VQPLEKHIMAIDNVSAAPAGAAQVSVPRALLANILASLRATNNRLVIIEDLCVIGIKADDADCAGSLLHAIRHTMGNDPDGLTDLMPEIEGLLGMRA
jgi:hypothetical protein